MKKKGILNAKLIQQIASLAHMDLFMIGDAGMPIPKGVEVIDLVLCGGIPTFEQVLDSVLNETEIEYYYIADEISSQNKQKFDYIKKSLPDVENNTMSHNELKVLSGQCKFAIRTGECTPYSNIILRAGVTFSADN